uniref:Uncharacterized protein n=1 Tax=Strigops habroptila TaxID=2489341 RepID=A0A672UBJ6_STRHB
MAAARGCPPAGCGDRALAELLLEFSRAQYRAKDGGGAAAAKVDRIERRCLELFGRDYRYSVISNAHGEVCAHYPRHIVLLERDAGCPWSSWKGVLIGAAQTRQPWQEKFCPHHGTCVSGCCRLVS